MRLSCQDLTCEHSEANHRPKAEGPCQLCPCQTFRYRVPRQQQLQVEFAKLRAKGHTFIDWLSVPDPTAEKPQPKHVLGRKVEVIRL